MVLPTAELAAELSRLGEEAPAEAACKAIERIVAPLVLAQADELPRAAAVALRHQLSTLRHSLAQLGRRVAVADAVLSVPAVVTAAAAATLDEDAAATPAPDAREAGDRDADGAGGAPAVRVAAALARLEREGQRDEAVAAVAAAVPQWAEERSRLIAPELIEP